MPNGWLDPAKYEHMSITSCTGPGTQYDGYAWKFVLHTTESPAGSINGINSLFQGQPCSAPHLCIDPAGTQRRVQYIPWTISACALRGGRNGYQTNRGRAVQMEICGRAAESPHWSDEVLWQIADVIADVIRDGCPIDPHVVNDFTQFTGVLATENAAQRMDPETWRLFPGITAHVEVIFNDHWDTGKLDSLKVAAMVRDILAGVGYTLGPPSSGTGGTAGAVQVGYIRSGMAGGIVKFLQELLIGLGFDCGPSGADSMFGPATDAATRAFQASRNIGVDGIWGPVTMQAMSAAYAGLTAGPTPPPPPTPGTAPSWPGRFLLLCDPMMFGEDVRVWQQRMADRGWSIAVDGWYGLESLSVCKTFQQEKGLRVDGVCGLNTWNSSWSAPVT
jgi:peptidoglycan hydrolase-like protein with peptidoglycan-binding domain